MGALGLFLVYHKVKAGLLIGILFQIFITVYAFGDMSGLERLAFVFTAILYGTVLHYLAFMKLDIYKPKAEIEYCEAKGPWLDWDGATLYCELPKHTGNYHRSGDWDWTLKHENKNTNSKKEE